MEIKMTSNIFDYIGMGNLDPAVIFIALLVLVVILFVLVIIQFSKISKLKKTYEKFMSGRNVKSLEKEIMSLFEDIDFLKNSFNMNSDAINSIRENLSLTYQKVGIIRYDAFHEMGGKLSFSIALLNDQNDGFILNSVHSTEGCYTYTKEIVAGESFISLGDEEREALNKAKNCNKSQKERIVNKEREKMPRMEKIPVVKSKSIQIREASDKDRIPDQKIKKEFKSKDEMLKEIKELSDI